MTSSTTLRFSILRLLAGAAVVCALLGCKKNEVVTLPKDDIVLARVAGKPITQYDVNQLARRSIGDLGGESARRTAQGKLLEGLIQSRAIAAAAEKELSPLDKLSLERELASHREQLLVRRYLEKHAPAAPVTPEMISEYYRSHPERFGGKTRHRCELLGASRDLTPDERTKVMKALREADTQSDWASWSAALIKKGLPVSLTQTTEDDQLLHPKLTDLMRSLKPQTPSQVVLVGGRPYVARITGEEKSPPRPLAEVRAEIERLLSPAQLSASLERVGKEARKGVEVEILPAGKAVPGVPSAAGRKP